MTQTRNNKGRNGLRKKLILATLGLLFCITNTAMASQGNTGAQAKAVANIKQMQEQSTGSPNQRVQAVHRYLHTLSEDQIIQLTQEIGSERFAQPSFSSPIEAKTGSTAKRSATMKMAPQAKMNPAVQMSATAKTGGQPLPGDIENMRHASDPQASQKRQLQERLRSPETRERHLAAIANYLLNTTK